MEGKVPSVLVLFSCISLRLTCIKKPDSLLLTKVINAILSVEIEATGTWRGTCGRTLEESA
jgi:hypothetical protein